MQVRRRSHKLLAFIALVVPLVAGFVASAGAQEAAPQPTITSDLADYPPGAMLLMACGLALATQIVNCQAGKANCNGTAKSDTINGGTGELDSTSCGLGEGDVAFVDQADLDAEGTDMQDFVRLTSCEEIVEPSIEEPPIETVSAR